MGGLSDADLENFVDDWARFDEHATWLLPVADLKYFMQVLDEPMGFGEAYAATESKLHMFDVATALGRRVVAKVAEDEGGDSLLEEEVTAAEDETTVDATPHLKKLFAQKEG